MGGLKAYNSPPFFVGGASCGLAEMSVASTISFRLPEGLGTKAGEDHIVSAA